MFCIDDSQIHILGIHITFYAVLPVLGIVLSMAAAAMLCKRLGWQVRASVYAAALVFSAMTVLRLYQDDLPPVVLPFMIPLGQLGIMAAAYIAGRRLGQPGLHVPFIFTIPLYLGVSKLGCFLSGCCYGRPYGGVLSVTYGSETLCRVRNVPLFPAQLVTALLLFAVAAAAYVLVSRRRDNDMLLALCGLTPLVYYGAVGLCDPATGNIVLSYIMAAVSLAWTLFWLLKAFDIYAIFSEKIRKIKGEYK